MTQRYEHETVQNVYIPGPGGYAPNDLRSYLRRYEREGWELAGTVQGRDGKGPTLIFKRPI